MKEKNRIVFVLLDFGESLSYKVFINCLRPEICPKYRNPDRTSELRACLVGNSLAIYLFQKFFQHDK